MFLVAQLCCSLKNECKSIWITNVTSSFHLVRLAPGFKYSSVLKTVLGCQMQFQCDSVCFMHSGSIQGNGPWARRRFWRCYLSSPLLMDSGGCNASWAVWMVFRLMYISYYFRGAGHKLLQATILCKSQVKIKFFASAMQFIKFADMMSASLLWDVYLAFEESFSTSFQNKLCILELTRIHPEKKSWRNWE